MDNTKQSRILIVDDTPENIDVMGEILKPYYRRSVALNGEKALKIAGSDNRPDLILLDIMMPGIDGYEVCRRLKENHDTREIPVIFVTAKGATYDEALGFEVGAVDYITKPVSPPLVLTRVKAQLELSEARHFLQNQNRILEEKVAERTKDILLTQDITIQALASLAETRDNETGMHIRRTQKYVRLLAENLASNPHFAGSLDDATIMLLYKSAPLHDIGKVGIPDSILLKPGKLTDAEFEIMKNHSQYGYDALLRAEESVGDRSTISFLKIAGEITLSHHEKWNGSGYPNGIAGDEIPISARLMAIADVYDALVTKRVYKPAFTHEKAVGIIREERGTHFDPDIVDAFLELNQSFNDIAVRFSD